MQFGWMYNESILTSVHGRSFDDDAFREIYLTREDRDCIAIGNDITVMTRKDRLV